MGCFVFPFQYFFLNLNSLTGELVLCLFVVNHTVCSFEMFILLPLLLFKRRRHTNDQHLNFVTNITLPLISLHIELHLYMMGE